MIEAKIPIKHALWRTWAKAQQGSDAQALVSLLDVLIDFERQGQSEAVLSSLRLNVYTLIGKLLWAGAKAPGGM